MAEKQMILPGVAASVKDAIDDLYRREEEAKLVLAGIQAEIRALAGLIPRRRKSRAKKEK